MLKAPEPRSATCMRDREFWTPNMQLQLQLQLHNRTWCCTPATDVQTHKVSPFNTHQVSFDAKILHTLSSPPHIFIQDKKLPKILDTCPIHLQQPLTISPHMGWIQFCTTVPRPNHTQPMGRCQKKLKGEQSMDQCRNCLQNSLGKNLKLKMCSELCNASVVHPVALPNLIPAEPYYRSPKKRKNIALLTYLYTLKCRELWAGTLSCPPVSSVWGYGRECSLTQEVLSDILLEVCIYLPGFNPQYVPCSIQQTLKRKSDSQTFGSCRDMVLSRSL